ncbi:NEDD4-binding protein 1 isoform X2 [Orussus abietinus]|uniref:NEDD4-binding protein 1 isoform X2 n=1 Tax=Orussus abietinus TaxID=222816 RepID=UPI0006269695|nr:NEDD4-binding protein 1 isoform X2 [Orussus abietinus]
MSTVNDSVIICETPSPQSAVPKKRKLRAKKPKIKRCKITKKPVLQSDTESEEDSRCTNTVQPSGAKRKREENSCIDWIDLSESINCEKKRKTNKRSFVRKTNIPISLQESVIILSDSSTSSKEEGQVNPSEERLSQEDIILIDNFELGEPSHESTSTKKRSCESDQNSVNTRRKTSKAGKSSNLYKNSIQWKLSVLTSKVDLNDRDKLPTLPSSNSSNQEISKAEDVSIVWTSVNDSVSTNVEQVTKYSDEPPKLTEEMQNLLNGPMVYVDKQGDFSNLQNLYMPVEYKEKNKNQIVGNLLKERNVVNMAQKKPAKDLSSKPLREIIIDGCNIAMAHANNKKFSEAGIKLVIDYFAQRGHTVKAFLPQHTRSFKHPLLEKLYNNGTVVFTPSRKIGGRKITPYDDREKPEWRDTIENRLLPPTFVGDIVMFPEDPLGRNGPTLEEFLRHL